MPPDTREVRPGEAPPDPGQPPEAERPPQPGGGRRGAWADLASDPEIAPLLLKQRQRQVAVRYTALIAQLGLAPDQARQLEALIAEKQISRFEAQTMAWRQELDRGEAQALVRQSDEESDQAIRALLGDGGFAQYQSFDSTLGQRATVENLAVQLGYAGVPLSAAQQEQLIAVLAQNGTGESPGGPGGMDGPRNGGGRMAALFGRDATPEQVQTVLDNAAAHDAAALRQASAFLTPVQVAALREAQQDSADQLRLAATRWTRIRQTRAQGAR